MKNTNDIDALLPQTQCGECGYAACRPYAEALASGEETIDGCPPGGITTLKALGQLLKVDPTPYIEHLRAKYRPRQVVTIREDECIGCTKCIQSCPVDAILGSGKLMHSVIADECTGCELCIEPCPVDCIDIKVIDDAPISKETSNRARQRYENRQQRLNRQYEAGRQHYQTARLANSEATKESSLLTAQQKEINAALERVRAKTFQVWDEDE